MALGATEPPIQWVPETLSLGVKRPGREADHSPEVKECVELYLHYTNTSSWRGAELKKSQGQLLLVRNSMQSYSPFLGAVSFNRILSTRHAMMTRDPLNMDIKYVHNDSSKVVLCILLIKYWEKSLNIFSY
jgi:hypothetical protein